MINAGAGTSIVRCSNDQVLAPLPAPLHWSTPCTNQECTLHQLSPYIGKLKSVIAQDLVVQYSKPGDLVADVFCGSGTVPLEAAILGRRVFASDTSSYAITLTKGKLYAPAKLESALEDLDLLIERAETLPMPDLRSVPKWVRKFFHPRTLKECLRIGELFKKEGHHFFLACLLGILHHQRPGFLSFPSSHLVPYLRSKKYPKEDYPDLYEYRPVAPRLKSKVKRALRRAPTSSLRGFVSGISETPVDLIDLPGDIDCVITSPPYMNALDYVRDNRLRLWLLGESTAMSSDRVLSTLYGFRCAIEALAKQLQEKVRIGGYCIFVVGDQTVRNGDRFPSEELIKIFARCAPGLDLRRTIHDTIPDIRRSRKNLRGVKRENILVFRKG